MAELLKHCFARPSHNFLGLSTGTDFETKLFAKPQDGDAADSGLDRSRDGINSGGTAEKGATGATWILLRLPYDIKDLFDKWLEHHQPDRRKHILSLVRQARGGDQLALDLGGP